MSTPEEFEREMLQFGLTAYKRSADAVRTAFVAIATDVITETPADVGTAKSNWLPSIGVPLEDVTIPAYVPGSHGSTASENAEAAIGVAEGIARVYTDPAESLHLSNNLPYIEKLNGGSSTQAPALFFETAVARGAEAAKRVRLLD